MSFRAAGYIDDEESVSQFELMVHGSYLPI